jgi:ABC-type glycerol-3-phosphate transport system substrate-binding protein
MKKIFAILLAISAFGLVLSGCSKSEEGGDTGATAGATGGADKGTE